MEGHKLLSRWELIGWLPILAAAGLLGLGLAWPGPAVTQPAEAAGAASGLGAPANDSVASTTCTIASIHVYEDGEVVVYCSAVTSINDPPDFGMPGDAASALTTNRELVILNTAYTLGETVGIGYHTDKTQNPPHCDQTFCRRLYSAGVP